MTKFFDAATRPPRGGWSFMIAGARVDRYSETEILSALRAWRVNNGTFQSEIALQEELWTYYCSREPERCGAKRGTVAETPLAPRELTKEVIGPWIWQFLNLAAVRWHPGMKDWFLSLCDMIIVLLDCPICRDEWRVLLAEHPPLDLSTRLQVCQWVNYVHERVNAKLGKSPYPYERMVREYGAPLQEAA